MATSLTDPLTGRLLDGRYEVGRLVARGGMATVYEALDVRLDRTVAVKVMHPALAADAEFVARFIREARSAARLSHPNVVAVYDQGTDGDTVYLAMEYVPGETLRDQLLARGRLPAGEALALFEQVLAALAAAHKAGLVHRDVKPENILLADDGRVKVADFGLVRAVTSSVTPGAVTSGVLIGTVSYLAPEQVERSIADARSDVYAAGILLFEMLTGEKPYTGGTPMQVAYRHVHERVPPPSSRVPDVAPDLDTLVGWATARDPDARPRDAGELLAEVQRLRHGGRIRVDPFADGRELTVRQHTARLPVEPSHTLVVPREDIQARPPVSPAPPAPAGAAAYPAVIPGGYRRRRRRGWIIFLVVLVLGALAAGAGWWYAEGRFTTTPTITQGSDRDAAADVLDRVGLVAEFDEAWHETVPVGAVVETDPAAGARVLSGATVTVILSRGPERYEVPDVDGRTVDQAEDMIEEQNLQVADSPVEEYSETVDEGLVIRTDPPVGSRLRRDAPVTLVVSQGQPPVDVPTVEGLPREEAEEQISDAGLVPRVTAEEFHDTVPAGAVISQDPKDEQLFRGETVDLVISKGPPLVEVPDLVRKQQGEAEEILEAAGFVVEIDYPLGSAIFFTVYNQSPVAGTMLPRGSTVTLQIV